MRTGQVASHVTPLLIVKSTLAHNAQRDVPITTSRINLLLVFAANTV